MNDTLIDQIETDLREHGERVVTLYEYREFKMSSNMSFTLEDIEGSDELVRLVRL